MAGTFLFELVSPEKLLLSEQVLEVVLPASEGYMTVLANRAPVVLNIVPGIVKVKTNQGEKSYIVYGGFADINGEVCSLLAELAITIEDFKPEDLEERIAAAQDKLKNAASDDDRNDNEDFLHQLSAMKQVMTVV